MNDAYTTIPISNGHGAALIRHHASCGTPPRLLGAQGLSVLRNRGYDSAGMATSAEDGLVVSKYASRGELAWLCVAYTALALLVHAKHAHALRNLG